MLKEASIKRIKEALRDPSDSEISEIEFTCEKVFQEVANHHLFQDEMKEYKEELKSFVEDQYIYGYLKGRLVTKTENNRKEYEKKIL